MTPTTPLRGLVFDFDGTMIDTETPVYDSAREMYEAHGVTAPTKDEWILSIGHTSQPIDIYDDVVDRSAETLRREDLVAARRRRTGELVPALALRSGVEAWIDHADAEGIPLAVASSSPEEWVRPHLESRGLLQRFVTVSCAGGEVPGKPDPAVYRIAHEALGLPAHECVAIEDSPAGVRAAIAAGMRCIATPGPMTASLDFSHADLVVPSLAEVDPAVWLLAQ